MCSQKVAGGPLRVASKARERMASPQQDFIFA